MAKQATGTSLSVATLSSINVRVERMTSVNTSASGYASPPQAALIMPSNSGQSTPSLTFIRPRAQSDVGSSGRSTPAVATLAPPLASVLQDPEHMLQKRVAAVESVPSGAASESALEGGSFTALQGRVATLENDRLLQERVAALESIVMQQEQANSSLIVTEVQGLRRMFEKLQKQQEDMCWSIDMNIEKRFDAAQVDISDLQLKMRSVQDLRITDVLDHAESEVQDLRASLEKRHERHEADADDLRRQQLSLSEQLKQLQGDEQLGALCGGKHGALHARVERIETKLVTDLETKLVAEQARMARQELDHACLFQSMLSRLNALEDKPEETCISDRIEVKDNFKLHDLQALVERQLLEENTLTGARCPST